MSDKPEIQIIKRLNEHFVVLYYRSENRTWLVSDFDGEWDKIWPMAHEELSTLPMEDHVLEGLGAWMVMQRDTAFNRGKEAGRERQREEFRRAIGWDVVDNLTSAIEENSDQISALITEIRRAGKGLS